MANQVVQLYDQDSQPIDPKSTATAIYGGVTVPGNSTVYDDLNSILSQLQELRRQVSGAEEMENQLSIQVFYSTNNYDSKSDAMNATYGDTFQIPTARAPYTWKKTIFKWGQDVIGQPIYEIIATALYPETQVMYASLERGQTENLGGPSAYGDNISDRNNGYVKWYTYFPGIDHNHIYGYISTRHREAGQSFPLDEQGGGWHTNLFAQYPVTVNE